MIKVKKVLKPPKDLANSSFFRIFVPKIKAKY